MRAASTASSLVVFILSSTMDSGVTLNILYILIEVDGESVVELDKMNTTYKVNGVDLLAEYKEMC